MRVVVIGAGVVGAAVAAGLARRGALVTVLEAGRPGGGTSGTTFAWVNSANKEPEAYFALNHAGMRAHYELAAGHAPWFVPTGNLEWATTDEHRARLADRMDRLRPRDYPARWLTAAQARDLEPDLAGSASGDFAFFPEEAHVLPVALLARLLGEARDLGATVHTGASVTEVDGGTVRTAAGDRHEADVVVSCTGRWTTSVAALAGVDVPMRDGPAALGFLTTTTPLPVRLSRVLHTSRLGLRPDGGGRLLLQAIDLDHAADPAVPVAPDGPVAAEVSHRLATVLDGVDGVRVESVRVGQRALPSDGHTVAGFAGPRFYVVATHSGITLAPLLADVVADEVFGTESALLTSFRPDRFARR